MHSKKIQRVLAGVALYASVFFLPWWVTLSLGFFFAFLFKNYFEFIGSGILIDVLYGVPIVWFFNIGFLFSLGTLVLYFLIQYLKIRLRIYV